MKPEGYVRKEEWLYRAIKRSQPGWLDYGRPTTAMFRDRNGVSVDRDGGRSEQEIRVALKDTFGNRLKGAAKVLAEDCYKVGADIEAAPSEGNIFHANIWLDRQDREKRMLQAYLLAKACEIVFIDEHIDWI